MPVKMTSQVYLKAIGYGAQASGCPSKTSGPPRTAASRPTSPWAWPWTSTSGRSSSPAAARGAPRPTSTRRSCAKVWRSTRRSPCGAGRASTSAPSLSMSGRATSRGGPGVATEWSGWTAPSWATRNAPRQLGMHGRRSQIDGFGPEIDLKSMSQGLRVYKEIQIHGEVSLKRNVQRLVANKKPLEHHIRSTWP